MLQLLLSQDPISDNIKLYTCITQYKQYIYLHIIVQSHNDNVWIIPYCTITLSLLSLTRKRREDGRCGRELPRHQQHKLALENVALPRYPQRGKHLDMFLMIFEAQTRVKRVDLNKKICCNSLSLANKNSMIFLTMMAIYGNMTNKSDWTLDFQPIS